MVIIVALFWGAVCSLFTADWYHALVLVGLIALLFEKHKPKKKEDKKGQKFTVHLD